MGNSPEAVQAVQAVRAAFERSAQIKLDMLERAGEIAAIAEDLATAFRAGNRLYACGNGGSACDAMHLVEELVARYRRERPGLPAHHLLDGPTLTCWSNDYDFRTAFRRQVEALGREGDILFAITTSGNSPNVLEAADAARERGMRTVALTGRDGGALAARAERSLIVPAHETERIQEAHIVAIHAICDLVERMLFFDLAPDAPASSTSIAPPQ